MEIFEKGNLPVINVAWDILKGHTAVKEDFCNAQIWVFLTCHGGCMIPLSVDVVSGTITCTIHMPDLVPGVYGVKALWVKDAVPNVDITTLLAQNKRCCSEVPDLFGVTTDACEVTINSASVKLKVRSNVATYGYDGLSAYEKAVLLGKTNLSEEEWIDAQNSFPEALETVKEEFAQKVEDTKEEFAQKVDNTKEEFTAELNTAKEEIGAVANEAKDAAESAVEAADGAKSAAESAVEAADDAAESATNAEDSAAKAEQHAKNVDDALAEIAGSGDIPAATVAKVAEHTTQITEISDQLDTAVFFGDTEEEVEDIDADFARIFRDKEAARQKTFSDNEAAREKTFSDKEATRDAANQAAIDAAETLAEHGAKISELEGEISTNVAVDVNSLQNYNYVIGSSGKWGTNGGYKHKLIEVTNGESYIISNDNSRKEMAFLTSDEVVSEQDAPFVSGYGLQTFNNGDVITIPAGTKYLYIRTGTDVNPFTFTIYRKENKFNFFQQKTEKVTKIDETNTDEQYPSALSVHKEIRGIRDALSGIRDALQIDYIDGLPITFAVLTNIIIDSTGLIKTSEYSNQRIMYAYIPIESTLHVNYKRVQSSRVRGLCGYVDNLSQLSAGNYVSDLNGSQTEDYDIIYGIPAGKYFVINFSGDAGNYDIVSVNYAKLGSQLVNTPQNIIDGCYSWWTAPHCDRLVKGREDYSIAAYQKSNGDLCVALYDNNRKTYTEKKLLVGNGIDDHNGPACSFLPDGRIIVTCAKGHAKEPNQYIFISTNAFDVDVFSEKIIETIGNCTYSRLIIHGGYIFIFWREIISDVDTTHSYWHCIYSTDEFVTDSGELNFIKQSYTYLVPTTDPDYIKIYPCGHPIENSVDLNKIRSGYIKLSTMEILKGDGVTKVADLGEWVENTDFDVIIDSSSSSKNRLLDAAITDVGVDRFVYAKGNPSSSPYDGKYCYYNNGINIEIVNTGEPFYTASKYVGGCIICRENNDCLLVAREDNGKWKLEKVYVLDGEVVNRTLLDFSEEKILRPFETNGCQFIYQKGGYDNTSFHGFKTNIIVKDIFY